MRRRSATGR
jgi:hypothetical protein